MKTNDLEDVDTTGTQYKNPVLLKHYYIDEGLSAEAVGERLGCSERTVIRYLRKNDIPIGSPGPGDAGDSDKITEAILKKLYVSEGKSINDIAGRFEVHRSTVQYYLKKYGIETRSQHTHPELRDVDWLRERYLDDKMTTHSIAELVGCAQRTVWEALNRYGIPLRGTHPMGERSEAAGNYYGTSWPIQRRACLKRDNWACVKCGITSDAHKEKHCRGLHVHHIERFDPREPAEHQHRLDNLLTLCPECHSKHDQ